MPKAKVETSSPQRKKRRPALDPKAREDQLISLANDVAEQQMLDGTVSSQVLTHYLKLGTAKAKLELKLLEKEEALIDAKIDKIESEKKQDEMYQEVLDALKIYNGGGDPEDYDDFEVY